MNVKQVIVIRKDLKMRRGKEISQGSHASLAWLSHRLRESNNNPKFSEAEQEWLTSAFAKVTLQVESEEDLRQVFQQAKEAGLEAHLIIDSGRTEFDGIPTATAVGIGPDEVSKIDKVTGRDSSLGKMEKVKLY